MLFFLLKIDRTSDSFWHKNFMVRHHFTYVHKIPKQQFVIWITNFLWNSHDLIAKPAPETKNANFGLYGAHLTQCYVMTLMYNCYMLLTRCDFKKIEFYSNERVTQRKHCAEHKKERVKMQCLFSSWGKGEIKIKIIFPRCTNFNFFFGRNFKWNRSFYFISTTAVYFYHKSALEWSLDAIF